MTRNFTGWHAFFLISGGFLIVAAVNALLAVMAVRTNQATVVDNAYVASQHFNAGLAAGRAQRQLGWTVTASTEAGQLRVKALDARGGPLAGLAGQVTLTHTLGAEPAQTRPLVDLGGGRYDAGALPDGRWIAEFRLDRGAQDYYLKQQFDGGQ